MAREKNVQQTAAQPQDDRENDPITTDEPANPFDLFAGESAPIRLNIRRVEPQIENGIAVAGFLPSLNLSPGEAQSLVDILSTRPGYGGGVYVVQTQVQQPDGRYKFSRSFRLRIAGRSRALESEARVVPMQSAETVVPMQPAQTVVPMAIPPMQWQQPPAWMQQPTPPPPPQADLPQLLKWVGDFAARQNAPSMDMVQLIQALQRTVHGEDDLTKFMRFAQMMKKIEPDQSSPAADKTDWSALLLAAKEVLRPAQAQAPAPIAGPPGWNFDPHSRRWVRASPPPQIVDVPAPPGMRWDATHRRWETLGATSEAENEADENENESEGEEEAENESENEAVYTADEITQFLAAQLAKMPDSEVEKLKGTVKQFATMF